MMNQSICIIVTLCVKLTNGIVIRPDRSDSDYVVNESEYPATFKFPEGNNWDCAATVLDSRHALTAAHCVQGLGTPFNVRIAGTRYSVDNIYKNPCFSFQQDGPNSADLAILHFSSNVSVVGIPIYGKCDEIGHEFTLIGWGDTGVFGGNPKPNNPEKLRRGNNIFTNTRGNTLEYAINSPNNGSLNLEAIAWSGDSGGPAMIEDSGKLYIVGVNSAGDCCQYGHTDEYARVSSDIAYNWITASIARGSAEPISNSICNNAWKHSGTPACTQNRTGPSPGPTPTPPAPAPTPPSEEPSEEPSEDPEDPSEGSCVGKCGGYAGNNCYCDDECEDSGDCCSDYKDICEDSAPPSPPSPSPPSPSPPSPSPGSCVGKCGGYAGNNCYCDDECESAGDCCSDYTEVCESTGNPSETYSESTSEDPSEDPEDPSCEDYGSYWFCNFVKNYGYCDYSWASQECEQTCGDCNSANSQSSEAAVQDHVASGGYSQAGDWSLLFGAVVICLL